MSNNTHCIQFKIYIQSKEKETAKPNLYYIFVHGAHIQTHTGEEREVRTVKLKRKKFFFGWLYVEKLNATIIENHFIFRSCVRKIVK